MPIISGGSTGSGSSSIIVTDGVTTVNPASTVDFTSGATVTNAGGGQASVAISATAPAYNTTATKTANYTAAASDWVVCDTTGGAFTVTMPAAPANNTTVVVEMVAGTQAVTAAAGAGDTISTAVATVTSTNRRVLSYIYRSSDKVWYGSTAFNGSPVLTFAVDGTTIVNTGSSTAPNIHTGTLDVLAATQAPAADWSNNSHKITSLAVATAATDAASLANTLDQFGAPAANVAWNAKKITGLAVATAGTDAASLANTLDQFGAPAANVAWNAKKITGLAVATAGTDAASLANTLDQFGAPAANVAWNAKKITGLANATAATDAAAYGQVPVMGLTPATNDYMTSQFASGNTTSNVTLADMYAVPIWLPVAITIKTIACTVNTAAATAVMRLGIYNAASSGKPGGLLVDFGTIDASTTGAKTIGSLSQAAGPGLFYLVCVTQVATCQYKGFQQNSWSGPAFPIANDNTVFQTPGQNYWKVASTSGALPGSPTWAYVGNTNNGSMPIVGIQAA